MPMHDWTKVPAAIYHAFHFGWVVRFSDTLNRELLPKSCYALSERVSAGFIDNALTLQRSADDEPDLLDDEAEGGVATASKLLTRPKTRFTAQTEVAVYSRIKKSVVVRRVGDDRAIAVLDIVSPGNKSSRKSFQSYVDKAWELLDNGIHLSIIDPFPTGPHDPNGVHGAVWEEIEGGEPFALPAELPLTLVAYECDDPMPRAYIEPVAVGRPLPQMPLFLVPNGHINVPLEATYESAFAVQPQRWRTVLAPGAGR